MKRYKIKRVLGLVAILLIIVNASAQDITQLAGIYAPYPDKETQWHKAPAGYKPVYLAHLGRHGSRFHSDAYRYDNLLGVLEMGEKASVLTEQGKQLLAEVKVVAEHARGHYGSLTALGYEEHSHIMQRFCRRYPELFAAKAWKVDVYAATKTRCLISMATSTDAIKEFNPKIRFDRHCNDSTQREYFDFALTQKALANAESFLTKAYGENPDSQPLIDKFFKDSGKYIRKEDRKNFGLMLLDVASAAYEDGIDLWKYLTVEEMLPFWRRQNLVSYYRFGPSAEFSEISRDQVRKLLLKILEGADTNLSGGEYRATLFYGRDVQVIPMADLLGIEGCCTAAAEGQPAELVWKDYEVSPMASNIQLLFFRKDASDDILVKILHNEKECRLSGIKTESWPYYHWTTVRKTLYDRVRALPGFRTDGWQIDTLSPGLVYMRYSGYEDVTRSNQLVYATVVDLNNPRYRVDFSYSPQMRVTSRAFKDAGAVASMNAAYECESVVVKTEGKLHYNIPSDVVPFEDAVPQWKSDCVICTDGKKVSIEYTGKDKSLPQMREAYASMAWPEMLGSSPMLIEKYVPVGKYFAAGNYTKEYVESLEYENPLRHQGVRHPRCAVALTEDNHLILISVDGRRQGVAEGMSAWELTTFIEKHFHPMDAINMDGGGSTTMCVKGRGDSKTNVVNYPSKSKTYRHDHERALPTHIHIIDTQAVPGL